MDQLKQYLSVVLKYHFWIICGVVVLLFLGTWFVATGDMSEQTSARITSINSAYQQGQSILSVTDHPNDKTAEMMQQLNQAEALQVQKAWELRYREQEDVLVWPTRLLPDFIAAVEDLKPIELKIDYPTPTEQELPPDLLGRYREYIENELPELAKIIGSRWEVAAVPTGGSYGDMMGGDEPPSGGEMEDGGDEFGSGEDESGGDGYGTGMPATSEEESVVVAWSTSNQQALQQTRFAWPTTPTTLQVLYAQEDLWVLRALMNIIKDTNGDADAQYNAAVKEIVSIDLGASARGIKEIGGVAGVGSGGSFYGSGGEEGEGDAGDPSMMGSGSGSSPYSSSGGTSTGTDPAEHRYVDADNEPLSASKLRSSMKSTAPTDAFLVVAKRMPVRVRFKMNVLKLPLLLSVCANNSLPVEVRQVRINAPAGGAASGGFGSGGGGFEDGSDAPSLMGAGAGVGGGSGAGESLSAPGDDMGSGGGFGSGSGGFGSGSGGFGSGSGGFGSGGDAYGGDMEGGYGGNVARPDFESAYDAEVEIYGIIYIYNPVDPTKLGLPAEDAAGTDPAADAAAAAALDLSAGTTTPVSSSP